MNSRIVPLSCFAALTLLASSGQAQSRSARTTEQPRREAIAGRNRELAAAASLTEAQAATVFAQIRNPWIAPRVRGVVTDARPDGARRIYGFFDLDLNTECVLGSRFPIPIAEARRDCRGDRGTRRVLFLVQVDAAGTVTRTSVHLPFARAGARREYDEQLATPETIRLFAPIDGGPALALLEVGLGFGATRHGTGEVESPGYEHLLYVWGGGEGIRLVLGNVFQPGHPYVANERIVSLAIDAEHHRLVLSTADCEDGCRCSRPSSLAQEATLVDRASRARDPMCRPVQAPLVLPTGARVVDDDLDARTPSGTTAEARASRASRLMAAAAMSESAAAAVIEQTLPQIVAPTFDQVLTHALSDGSREHYVRVEHSEFLECVYAAADEVRRYDAVRACAHLGQAGSFFVRVLVGADGELRAPPTRAPQVLGRIVAARLYAPRADRPAYLLVETFDHRPDPVSFEWFRHELDTIREGRPARITYLSEMAGRPGQHVPTDARIAELIVGADRSSAVVRVAPCNDECPCASVPADLEAERALLREREQHTNPRCRARERALMTAE